MVFGWGKKKQEEYVERIPQEKEVQLSDVPKIVTELNELRKSQIISEIKHLRNNTGPLMDELMQIGNVLDKDNLKVDDIDIHLSTIVIRGKKQVIDVIKKNVVYLPEISSIDDAKKLNSLLNQILKKLGDVLGRQTRVIHIFAKKYANQLKRNLEVMNNNNSEIHNLLKNYDSEQSASDEITNTLNQIKTLKESQLEKNQKIDKANQSVESFDEKITSIQNSIAEIKSSENYKKYLDMRNTLDAFTAQKSKIKNEVDTQFTKISRPLSRYEYGSALDKEQKNLLTRLIKNPLEVLTPQNKDSIILILENVRKGISSGSISVKDIDKSLSYITETEETLDNFVTQILEYLEKKGLLEKKEKYEYSVPFGDRSGEILEPFLTDQWFVDAKKLSKEAIKAVKEKKISFLPQSWEKIYFDWLENIQPWCISRQIWWGHKIPIWYGPDNKPFAGMNKKDVLNKAEKFYKKKVDLIQDQDVLDTWFSSSLWPFSTLGWPDETKEYKKYYPTDLLITGFDIIFFWVARMIMMGLFFTKKPPFKEVYIHALIRDEKGQKMSKSKGNVIDPLELTNKYGADALRFTLSSLASPGRDIKLSTQKVESSRNFATKIWNASRYILLNDCKINKSFKTENFNNVDNQWIIQKVILLIQAIVLAL